MSRTTASEIVKDHELVDNVIEDKETNGCSDVKSVKEESDGNAGNPMPSPQQEV